MRIRNLDDPIIAGLKRRAAENRTSAAEEARRVLTTSVGFDIKAWLTKAQALRDEVGPLPGPDSTEILRRDRARDRVYGGVPRRLSSASSGDPQ